jgi:hypothetical protein
MSLCNQKPGQHAVCIKGSDPIPVQDFVPKMDTARAADHNGASLRSESRHVHEMLLEELFPMTFRPAVVQEIDIKGALSPYRHRVDMIDVETHATAQSYGG